MNRITSGVHRTGGQFYDLYPAYVGPGLASWAASFVLVIRSNADERQRQTTSRAIRRLLMRAGRCDLKPRAGRRTVRGARRGAYPKTPRQNNCLASQKAQLELAHQNDTRR